jgi:hypothetical protein
VEGTIGSGGVNRTQRPNEAGETCYLSIAVLRHVCFF